MINDDFKKYPYIVSNIFAAVLPEQGAVWGYPVDRIDENGLAHGITSEQTVMNMINAFIGRMHLASPVYLLNEKCLSLVNEGVEYYKKLSGIKKKALPCFPTGFKGFYSENCAFGLELKEEGKLYLAVWNFEKDKTVEIPLEKEIKKVSVGYPAREETVYRFAGKTLTIEFKGDYGARFFEIEMAE